MVRGGSWAGARRTCADTGGRVTACSRARPRGETYAAAVRLTDFWTRMDRRFGAAYARSYAMDQVLSTLGSRTVNEALAAGEDPKEIWRAVCDAVSAPATER